MLVCGRLSSRYSLPEKYVELTSCSIFILRMNCKHSSDMFPIATKRSGTLLHFELDVWWAGRLHISIHTEEAQVPSVMIRGKVASKQFWRGNENEQCFPGIFLEWRIRCNSLRPTVQPGICISALFFLDIDSQLEKTKLDQVYATALAADEGLLWVGTSVGVTLVFPLPQLEGIPLVSGKKLLALIP